MISIGQSKLGTQLSKFTQYFLGGTKPVREDLASTTASTTRSITSEHSAPTQQREFQVRVPNRQPGQKISRYSGLSHLDFFPYLQLDSVGRVVRANRAFLQQFEFDRESIVGLPVSYFIQHWETASLLKSLVSSARITSVASEWQSDTTKDSVPVLLYISFEPATRMFHMGVVPQHETNAVLL